MPLEKKTLFRPPSFLTPKRTIFFSEMVSIMNRLLFDLIFCMTAVRRKFLSSSWSGQQLVRLFFSRRRRPSVVLPLFFLVMQRKAEEEEEAKKVFPYFPSLSPSSSVRIRIRVCSLSLSLSLSFRPFACLPPPTLLRRFEVSCRIRAWGRRGTLLIFCFCTPQLGVNSGFLLPFNYWR